MNVVINGASGFIAPFILRELESSGHHVLATSRSTPKDLAVLGEWRPRDQILERLDAPADALVHLEVKQHVFASDGGSQTEFDNVNVEGTKTWLDWCGRFGVRRFVYFSSIKAVNLAGRPVGDEQSVGPNPTPYGSSKWQAEAAVRAWVATHPERSALILRPAVIYGPGNTANIAAMINAISRNRFFLLGANSNIKSIVSVRNVAAATGHLLERMMPGRCEVFCITDARSYSVREIDAMIRRALGKRGNSPALPIPLARLLSRAGDLCERLSGCVAPFDSRRLAALLEATHFSCKKLQDTGFVHPESTDQALANLIREDRYRPYQAVGHNRTS